MNELKVGTRRAGTLVDFDAETPEVHVTLERTQRGISVTVPWSDTDSPYAGWFDSEGHWGRYGDNAERTRVPERLLFGDSHGSVLLVGCWAEGFHTEVFGPGSGTVWARAAVLGVDEDIDYGRPHGLQTEISGLREWLGVCSWTIEIDWEQDGNPASIRSERVPPVQLGTVSGLKAQLRPGWQIENQSDRDRQVLMDLVRFQTISDDATAWHEHLDIHQALRDLLVLSRWHGESCVPVLATRNDDPVAVVDGKPHRPYWRQVVVPWDDRTSPPTRPRRHLIRYEDLGPGGIARWIDLRNEFSRALDPVISSKRIDSTQSTLLAHTGPGLEALGYLLMLRDGLTSKAAASTPLKLRLERVLSDIEAALPFDGGAWVDSTVAAYNGLKHANRQAPDAVDVANAWRECVLATRIWVALELGATADQIGERLRTDPQRYPYVKR